MCDNKISILENTSNLKKEQHEHKHFDLIRFIIFGGVLCFYGILRRILEHNVIVRCTKFPYTQMFYMFRYKISNDLIFASDIIICNNGIVLVTKYFQ